MKEFDLIVIGGGPGGYSAAITAAKRGLKTALFENTHLGGTCLNEGCVPTKYLADKAEAIERVRALTAEEIFRDPGFFSFKKIQQGKRAASAKLVSGVKFLLEKAGVQVINGQARLEPERVVLCGGEEYRAQNVILSTGAKPVMIHVPGWEHCIDSTGALELTALPKSMVVVGGGVIGLEMATAFSSYGAEVTVLEMMESLLPGELPEAVRYALSSMKKRGVRIKTGARLLRIEQRGKLLRACYELNGQEEAVEAEKVLMAVGRSANLAGIDAEKLGLQLDEQGFIRTDRYMRTNLQGVYAVGDVSGGIQLASVAYAEADAAVAHILGEDKPTGTVLIPTCIHTIPCFASVGYTPEKARQAGLDPVVGSFAYSANGMALAEGASGNLYVVTDKSSGRTIGVTIVGDGASEMIAFATQTVEKGMTVEEWEKTVVTHPSLSEMLKEAALDAFGRSVHKA